MLSFLSAFDETFIILLCFFLSPLLALPLLVSRVIRHGAVVRFALLYRMTIFYICWISFLVVGNSRCQKCIWTSCLSFNNETLLTIYRTKEREKKKPIENNNKSTFNSSSNDDDHNSDNDDQSSLFRNTPIRIKLNSKVFFLFARLEK